MRAYAHANSVLSNSRNLLIAEHVAMARRIACKVARRTPDWVTNDDLIGAAMIGLTEAADRFDPTRGEPFIAFAEQRIRGAVLDELRRGDLMSRRARSASRKISRTICTLEHGLGRAPEDHEIAGALGVPLETYREDLEMLTHVAVIDVSPIEATLRGDEAMDPAHRAERSQLVDRLREGLLEIPPRDAQILSLYYIEDLSYAEIGQVLDVSESRVCQLHARALLRLRAELADTVDEGIATRAATGEPAARRALKVAR